jgi:septation ring formation regulator EzrA
VLEQTVTRQSVQLEGLKETVIKTNRQHYKELLNKLEEMSKQVNLDMETFSSFLKSIDKSIKALQVEISALGRGQKRILENSKKPIE